MESRDRRVIRFGIFEADPTAGELRKAGRRVNLQEQPFRLLMFLLERPGEVVTRQELQGKLWGETYVDFEEGLNTAVRKLRDALSDSPGSPRFIETVPRRGYRFIAPLQVTEAGALCEFKGQANLHWWAGGVYTYEGRADGTNFVSMYRCKYDHGTFQMDRPQEATMPASKP